MRIIDLLPDDEKAIQQVAALLAEVFHWPNGWPTVEDALVEVRASFAEGRLSRVAVDEDGAVLGWIGGIRTGGYGGHVWELHPLVVRPDRQREGIGRALVIDLETLVRERGCTTLMLGTDDEDSMTTLAGVDLYPDICGHVAQIENLRGHPYTFYQKMGFVIVGVIPDANGPGKPDILMAKRVTS